jgi:hypothetical protein
MVDPDGVMVTLPSLEVSMRAPAIPFREATPAEAAGTRFPEASQANGLYTPPLDPYKAIETGAEACPAPVGEPVRVTHREPAAYQHMPSADDWARTATAAVASRRNNKSERLIYGLAF